MIPVPIVALEFEMQGRCWRYGWPAKVQAMARAPGDPKLCDRQEHLIGIRVAVWPRGAVVAAA